MLSNILIGLLFIFIIYAFNAYRIRRRRVNIWKNVHPPMGLKMDIRDSK